MKIKDIQRFTVYHVKTDDGTNVSFYERRGTENWFEWMGNSCPAQPVTSS
jgi:hypothetical protein